MFGCVKSDVSQHLSSDTKLTVNGWILMETATKRISRTVSELCIKDQEKYFVFYSEIKMLLRRRFVLILTMLFFNSFHGSTALILPEERSANR